jgi:hypothetical protein
MSEMAEKLKTRNNRVKTLASKIKAYEAEAEDIDELVFHKDFTFPAYFFTLLFLTRNLIA